MILLRNCFFEKRCHGYFSFSFLRMTVFKETVSKKFFRYSLKRSGVYLRLMTKNVRTREGKRYVTVTSEYQNVCRCK